MSRRNRNESEVQIEVLRGQSIVLNKDTNRYHVQEISSIDVESVRAARNAIDRHITELNKNVRRKVLTFRESSYGRPEVRKIREGEITSWTRIR